MPPLFVRLAVPAATLADAAAAILGRIPAREQAQKRTADRWAVFLWQAGVPDFRPR